MKNETLYNEKEITQTVEQYGDMLFGICFVMLSDRSDAEDAVQETVIKYIQKQEVFNSEEHKKAWLIKVASNQCRDMLRFRSRHRTVNLESVTEFTDSQEESFILDALMKLPEKFRLVLTLYYVEEYSIREIAEIIGKTQSAVKMRLSKGRKLLEEKYRKEYL